MCGNRKFFFRKDKLNKGHNESFFINFENCYIVTQFALINVISCDEFTFLFIYLHKAKSNNSNLSFFIKEIPIQITL